MRPIARRKSAARWRRHGFVDLGGDIRVIGPQPDGQPWRIGIRDPRDGEAVVAEVALHDGALATSGDYERFIEVEGVRYCHILDPRTGWPARGLSSVTVITERCPVAGSLATSAMLSGGRVAPGSDGWACVISQSTIRDDAAAPSRF